MIIFVYDNVTVSQKGLRNENSIEMMEIINGSRGVEFSQVTGITSALHQGLNGVFDLPRIPGETYAVDTVVYIQPDKRAMENARDFIDLSQSPHCRAGDAIMRQFELKP